jgi:hypothetical protein
LRPRCGLADPAHGRTCRHERFLVDAGRDFTHARKRADRRDVRKPPSDLALDLLRHEIAAVRVGADGHGLGFKLAQPPTFAASHIGIEGSLVLAERLRAGRFGACKRGPGALQRDLVKTPGVRIERGVQARELFVREHIAAALLDRSKALIVLLLERLEGAHHGVVDGLGFAGDDACLGLRRAGQCLDIHDLLVGL